MKRFSLIFAIILGITHIVGNNVVQANDDHLMPGLMCKAEDGEDDLDVIDFMYGKFRNRSSNRVVDVVCPLPRITETNPPHGVTLHGRNYSGSNTKTKCRVIARDRSGGSVSRSEWDESNFGSDPYQMAWGTATGWKDLPNISNYDYLYIYCELQPLHEITKVAIQEN